MPSCSDGIVSQSFASLEHTTGSIIFAVEPSGRSKVHLHVVHSTGALPIHDILRELTVMGVE